MLNLRFIYLLLIYLFLASYSTPIHASSSMMINSYDSYQHSDNQPTVSINGNNILFQGVNPKLVEGTTFVPVQFFEHTEIQANISYLLDSEYPRISIFYSDGELTIYPDRGEYEFFDLEDMMSRIWIDWNSPSPYLYEGNLMLPLRTMAERIGIIVGWDETSKTAILLTDDEYRAELESPEEWEEWIGIKPIELNDPSGVAITEDELSEYVLATGLPVLDFQIIDKYTAVLLYIKEVDGLESLTSRYVDRLRNGKLDFNMELSDGDNGKDVKVKRSGFLVSVGMFKQGLDKEFTHFNANYRVNGERVYVTYDIAGKQGMFIDIPEGVESGVITFYGKNGYTFDTYFW